MTEHPRTHGRLAASHPSYERGRLLEADAPPQPLTLFTRWLEEALQEDPRNANAMTVATVGADGQPSTRPVLLKQFDETGLVWYTNYESRKGRELAAHPHAALQFFWPGLQRVVRIEGPVQKVSAQQSDDYFKTRPLGSQLAAWASAQSRVLPDRGALAVAYEHQRVRFGQQVPRPPHWGGFRLRPQRWEFWQGRLNRMHDRLCYRPVAGGWRLERLSP